MTRPLPPRSRPAQGSAQGPPKRGEQGQKRAGSRVPVELRSLMLLGGVTVGVLVAAVIAWMGPWSPVALDAPSSLVAAGEPAAAVEAWLELSESPWAGDHNRRAALWRAAQISAVELDAPERADALAQRVLALDPQDDLRSDVLTLRAALAPRVGDGSGAAALLVAAANAAQGADRRGALLLEAAVLEEAQAQLDPAALVALYAEAAVVPSVAAEAQIHLGRLQLDAQPAAAYEAYARALQAGAEGDAARTARLGMATALERLEGRDAALAVVDEGLAEEPEDDSLRRRQRRLSNGRR